MTVLKSISGHTKLAKCKEYLLLGTGDVRAYFEGAEKDRCIAKDFLNIYASDQDNWDVAMDKTRSYFGNHSGRTYTHFIISPDPRNGIDLETLRDLAMAWCEEHFGFEGDVGAAEVAIMYHDDNSERIERGLPGIPHAHIIVNNTNLATGKRIHFSNKQNRDLSTSLSRLSKERGLSYFTVERREADGREVYERIHHKPSPKGPGAYDHRPSRQAVYRTKAERALEARGERSWKDEIRDYVEIASNMATDIDGLREALAEMGVVTKERTGSKALPGELLFYYPSPDIPVEENRKCVSGQRLGRKFTPSGLLDLMQLSYYQRLAADDRNERRVMSLVSDVNTVSVDMSAGVSLKDISRAFAAISEFRIQNVADAEAALSSCRKALEIAGDDGPSRAVLERQARDLDNLVKVSKSADILPDSPLHQRTRTHDHRAETAQRAKEQRGKVKLADKIDRGWRLTKAEHEFLKEKRPDLFLRWKNNRLLASQGLPVYDSESGSRKRGKSGAGTRGDSGPSMPPPSQIR